MAIAVMPREPKEPWTKWDYLLAAAVALIFVLFAIAMVIAYLFD